MRTYLVFLILIPVCWSAEFTPKEFNDLLQSESDLLPEWIRSQKANAAISNFSASKLIQWSVQTNFPSVRIFTFLKLSERDPFDALMVAHSTLISHRNLSSGEFSFFRDALTNKLSAKQFNFIFSRTAMSIPANQVVMPMIIYESPISSLDDWFKERRNEPVIPEWEAWVLKRLFEEEQPTDLMRSRLTSFRNIEGMPHLVCLLNSDLSKEENRQLLISVLNDDIAPEGEISRFIAKHLEIFEDKSITSRIAPRARRLIEQAKIRRKP